jgi:hypothetical protein
MRTVESLVDEVRTHRVFDHPMYQHWSEIVPAQEVTAAMFHQIQKFCASTRPGGLFPAGLRNMGWDEQAALIEEIVDSEAGHGPELAAMAGHIVNCSGEKIVFKDVFDKNGVETGLKLSSDRLLAGLPGYDLLTGHTAQAEAAIAVFRRRELSDPQSTVRNLGTALALEIISNQSLIPGEKRALVDSGNYGVTLDDPEMHYLAEHWGECGAEQLHEQNVIKAVDSLLDAETTPNVEAGVDDFLKSLTALWDVLDSAFLSSGIRPAA